MWVPQRLRAVLTAGESSRTPGLKKIGFYFLLWKRDLETGAQG